MDGLNDLRLRYPQHVSNVRGLGTFCAFDLSSVAKRDEVVAKLKEKGPQLVYLIRNSLINCY